MPAVWVPKVPKVAQQTVDASTDDEEHSITRAALLRYRLNDSSLPAANSLRTMTVPEYQSKALSELLLPPGLFPPEGLTDTVEVEKYNVFKPVAKEHLGALLQCLSANLDHIADNFVLASTSTSNDSDDDEYISKIQKTASESDLSTAASTDETPDETLSPRSMTKESVTKESVTKELSPSASTDETMDETSSEDNQDNQSSGSEAGSTEAAKEFVDPLADWLARLAAKPLFYRPGWSDPDDSPE